MGVLASFLQTGFLAVSVIAQYPSAPLGITKIKSTLQPGVEITYKEVTYVSYFPVMEVLTYLQTHLCETSPGVNSYSGTYVFSRESQALVFIIRF